MSGASSAGGFRDVRSAGLLFGLLLLSAVGSFAIERAARAGDDVVNTVVLTSEREGGRIEFSLAEPDDDVDVLIIEGDEDSGGDVVRTLEEGVALDEGPHAFRWDGRDDAGRPAPEGLYALEVVLGAQGRDVKPPGRIEVSAPTGGGGY